MIAHYHQIKIPIAPNRYFLLQAIKDNDLWIVIRYL